MFLIFHHSFLALYLDLRYQHLMSEDLKSRAVAHLIKTWELLNRLKNRFPTTTVESFQLETDDGSVNSNTHDKKITDDTDDEFQVYLEFRLYGIHKKCKN